MKIVEVIDGIVRATVTFWDSIDDIPDGVPDIYREAPDEVQEGWVYDPETGEFLEPPEPEPVLPSIPPITNEELMQATMHVTAMIDMMMDLGEYSEPARPDGDDGTYLSRYDFWRQAYFRKHVAAYTLQRLVGGGVLTREEVEGIVGDRVAEFGV